jgi:hypothetical protein
MYIKRTLTVGKGTGHERRLTQAQVSTLSPPFVLVGEPGLGKTELTKSLAQQLGTLRVTAGHFYRTHDLGKLLPAPGKPVIIDGLDEITPTIGSAVDEVLKKLSMMGSPTFILSCRAFDWEGALGRHKIQEDYGTAPLVVHLDPLSLDDAKLYLTGRIGSARAETLLGTVDTQGLSNLTSNPLMLRLLAELVDDGQPLPRTRGELFDKAAPLLLKEENDSHKRKGAALLQTDVLFDAAGAVFAHLLLSGATGIARSDAPEAPPGYVSEVDLLDIEKNVAEVLRTRLFTSDGEHLIVPVHRLVAEFVAARWLAARISSGLSKRRVLQSLRAVGGVPAALRGVHAWLAYFNPSIVEECIQADPYGMLRHGDINKLTVPHVRRLIAALSSLAVEDPYFRSEDWGVRAVSGLAGIELKDDILKLVTGSDRPLHLSTLLLEAVKGTPLAQAIRETLIRMMRSESTPYVERNHAMEALVAGDLISDRSAEIRLLAASADRQSRRLAIEAIQEIPRTSIPGTVIGDALIAYHGLGRDDRDRISGVDYRLPDKLDGEQLLETLEEIGSRFGQYQKTHRHWQPHHGIASTVLDMAVKALEIIGTLRAEQVWGWLRCIDAHQTYTESGRNALKDYLASHDELRRDIQRLAFASPMHGDTPWMAIIEDLPRVSEGLALTTADAAFFLSEIADKSVLTDTDINLWNDVVQSHAPRRGLSNELTDAVMRGTEKHLPLKERWQRLIAPPERNWEAERKQRVEEAKRKRAATYKRRRDNFLKAREGIKSGREVGYLNVLATAYLGLNSDIDSEARPQEWIANWVGSDVAEAAESGFIAVLSRQDLPTAQQIVESQVEGKSWNVGRPMLCGLSVMKKRGIPLSSLPRPTLMAVLAAWCEMPEHYQKLADGLESELEAAALPTEADRTEFARTMVEPFLRAGREDATVLYKLQRSNILAGVVGRLALVWLRQIPNAPRPVQTELMEIALSHGNKADVAQLVVERRPALAEAGDHARRDWTAVGFVCDAEGSNDETSELARLDPTLIWSIRRFVNAGSGAHSSKGSVAAAKRAAIIRLFANHWPSVPLPSSGRTGNTNPRDASEYIIGNIDALGADNSAEASEALDRLATDADAAPYHDHIRHVRAVQRRARRDQEYIAPTCHQIKQTLRGGTPGTIDDLKALTLDCLADVQKYIRDGDTRGWRKFWEGAGRRSGRRRSVAPDNSSGHPLDEETCRDRLLDELRPRMGDNVSLHPESLMPERKRVDILVLHSKNGLPIEIKGQWHDEVWDAAKTQLDVQYGRDWRAFGRGLYLVLWFGAGSPKALTPHPDGLPSPSTSEELRSMLEARLTESERARIDIVVFDVSAG